MKRHCSVLRTVSRPVQLLADWCLSCGSNPLRKDAAVGTRVFFAQKQCCKLPSARVLAAAGQQREVFGHCEGLALQ